MLLSYLLPEMLVAPCGDAKLSLHTQEQFARGGSLLQPAVGQGRLLQWKEFGDIDTDPF